jgi:hypothetical protein
MFNKKGQAALEFLTTYGWAFLVILVMIGALSYFGVLSPENYIPDSCNFGSVMSCSGAYAVTSTATDDNLIQISFTNLLPEGIVITHIYAKEKLAPDYSVDLIADAAWETGGVIKNSFATQGTDVLNIDTAVDLGIFGFIDSKKTILFDIRYTVGIATTIEKSVRGSITTTIIDGSP